MWPFPPMPTYPNLPSCPRSAVHVPEDLARYATGRPPLSNTPKLMRPTSSLGSHAEPTKALLRARPHGSRMGAMVVGRGTAHSSSRNRARAGQLTGSLCPPARCWRCGRVSLLTSNLTLHICYFALPPFHTDCRTGRQNIVGFACIKTSCCGPCCIDSELLRLTWASRAYRQRTHSRLQTRPGLYIPILRCPSQR